MGLVETYKYFGAMNIISSSPEQKLPNIFTFLSYYNFLLWFRGALVLPVITAGPNYHSEEIRA